MTKMMRKLKVVGKVALATTVVGKVALATFFAFGGLAAADMKVAPKGAARSMADMQGGCDNYAMPLSKEMMSLWDKNEIRIQGAQDDKSTVLLPSERRVNLSLYPQKKVNLPLKPEKDFSKGDPAFAGLATIDVKKDGLYRVSLGSKVWLDVVEAGPESPQVVPATQFEMQTGCKKIFKAVEYSLKAGKKYVLQISSSREPSAQVLTSFVK